VDLIIFGGPNGSGKSTLVYDYLEAYEEREGSRLHFICPDNYTQFFDSYPTDVRYAMAMDEAAKDRYRAVRKGQSFAFETVFSTQDKINFVRFARTHGYYILVYFITTSNPLINIERVHKRLSQGGHDVPKEKIIQRYHKSMNLLPEILFVADEVVVSDNSETNGLPVVILHKVQDEYYFLNKGQRPEWCNNLKSYLSDQGQTIYDLSPEETIEYFK